MKNYMPVIFAGMMLLSLLLMRFPINTDWLGLKDVSQNFVYVTFGVLLALCEKRLNIALSKAVKAIIAVMLFALSVVVYIYGYEVFKGLITVFMLFSLVLFAKALGDFCEKPFRFISKNVFTIYIYSWIFQSFVLTVLIKFNIGYTVLAPVMFVIGIVMPLCIALIYNKAERFHCKFFDLIFGIR